jgi:hypothetical protein
MIANNRVKRERERCFDILSKHRAELLQKLMNNKLSERQKNYLRHVITLLTKIGGEILETDGLRAETIKIGDFSEEEMERAQAIIEEQNVNPFEEGVTK